MYLNAKPRNVIRLWRVATAFACRKMPRSPQIEIFFGCLLQRPQEASLGAGWLGLRRDQDGDLLQTCWFLDEFLLPVSLVSLSKHP